MDGRQYKVYCHTSPNNKKYVGISINPEKRWARGNGYIKNYRLYPDIQKYGWDNFIHEILFENLSLEEAKEKEQELIKAWNLMDSQYGYNLTEGEMADFLNILDISCQKQERVILMLKGKYILLKIENRFLNP